MKVVVAHEDYLRSMVQGLDLGLGMQRLGLPTYVQSIHGCIKDSMAFQVFLALTISFYPSASVLYQANLFVK